MAGKGKAGWVGWTVEKVVCIMRRDLTFRTFIFYFVSDLLR